MSYSFASEEHERLALNPRAEVYVPGIRQKRIADAVDNLARITPEEVIAAAEGITADSTEFAEYDVAAGAERLLQEENAAKEAAANAAAIQSAQRAAREYAFDAKSSDIVPQDAAQSIADEDTAHIAEINDAVNRIRSSRTDEFLRQGDYDVAA